MYVYLCAVLIFLSETLEQAGEGRFYDTIEQPVWKSYRKSPYNTFFWQRERRGIDLRGRCCHCKIHFMLKGTKRIFRRL